MESLYLLIPLFFIILFLIPMSLKIRINYDVLKNFGNVSLHFFNIKIIYFSFYYMDKSLYIKSQKHKQKLEFELSENQKKFYKQFTIQLKQKIQISKIQIYNKIGIGEASNTAIICGVIQVINKAIFGYIKNEKYFTNKLNTICCPAYNEHTLNTSLYSKFSISLFDIIYSLLMSVLIIKRGEKYENI